MSLPEELRKLMPGIAVEQLKMVFELLVEVADRNDSQQLLIQMRDVSAPDRLSDEAMREIASMINVRRFTRHSVSPILFRKLTLSIDDPCPCPRTLLEKYENQQRCNKHFKPKQHEPILSMTIEKEKQKPKDNWEPISNVSPIDPGPSDPWMRP